MNRRGFLKSLVFVPAAVTVAIKAMPVSPKPAPLLLESTFRYDGLLEEKYLTWVDFDTKPDYWAFTRWITAPREFGYNGPVLVAIERIEPQP